MKYFFLFAHPEPDHSFQRALLDAGVTALEAAGHEVRVSDLYSMGFNPIASARDFSVRRFPDRLQYDREQKFSVENGALSEDIKEELEKVLWCDVFVTQFPLYWYSMPAIMKGWFDRVFVNTVTQGAAKFYETGGLMGRRAMACVSTGGYEVMFQSDGLLGEVEAALWHLHNGVFHYTGMKVLPPFMAWAPVRVGEDICNKYLADYAERLLQAGETEPKFYHPTADFGEDFRLRPGVTPATLGHCRSRNSQSNPIKRHSTKSCEGTNSFDA